jgi:hypothetical protein
MRLLLAEIEEYREAIRDPARMDPNRTLCQLSREGRVHYKGSGEEVRVGDRVLVEGNVPGTVVCDFDNWKSLDGYEHWLTTEELVGGGTLKSGIMVETTELGFVHLPEVDDELIREADEARSSD